MNNTSNRPWVIGGIVVALAMVAATWLLVVGPTRSTTSSLDDDTAAVQLQNAALVAKTNALAGQDRDQLVADVTAALGSLPPDAALPDFNRELTRHAKDRGVELASISVGAAAAPGEAGSTTATPGLVAVPVTIQTRGPALAQLFFLRDIQEVGPRAALVTTTSLAAQDDASIELNSTLTTQLTVFTASLSTSDLTALAAVVDPEVLGDAADPNASALPTDDTATD